MTRAITLRGVLIGLVAIHIVFGIARVPHSVVGERLRDIADHRARGSVRFHLDNEHRQGAAAVEWILEHVPEDAVVLHRGEIHGAFEFVPAMIWPRLLVEASFANRSAQAFAGRPIWRGEVPGHGRGQLVLVGLGDDLALETR